MGGSRHLKRLVAPRFWPLKPKEFKWAVKPSPGPHPIDMCIPLLVVVRDVLGYAKTAREAKRIIADGKIAVDGRVRLDYKYPVGLMDVVEIKEAKEHYRVLPVEGKGLALIGIPKEEALIKPCRIENKRTIKGGNLQLNFHDGSNILIKVKDPRRPEEDVYKTMETVLLKLPARIPVNHFRFREGAYAIITAGKNVGKHGLITEIEEGKELSPTVVALTEASGLSVRTVQDFVFIVGEEKPAITVVGKGV